MPELSVSEVLQQLRENKKKSSNHSGCTRRIKAKKRKPRQKKYWSKPIGKHVGYCPHCMIIVGDMECSAEVPHRCTRCGTKLPQVESLPAELDYELLRDWRQHDKWGNCKMPSNQTRAECLMGANIIRKLAVDNHNRRPQA